MANFEVVLPTTTEEWQRDMKIAYNQALEDFVENISLPMTEEQIGEIVEKLKR